MNRSMRNLLQQPAAQVAPRLLGSVVTSRIGGHEVRLRLTEVEAYGGVDEDPGSHAFRRQTPRNASMFGPAGHAYVYFTYGMHWCLNVVTSPEGQASAVLLRAGQILNGVPVARRRRGESVTERDLARGPARLANSLGVTKDLDGVDLLDGSGPLSLLLADGPILAHASGPRTGVRGEGSVTPWRFFLEDEPTVSRYRRASP